MKCITKFLRRCSYHIVEKYNIETRKDNEQWEMFLYRIIEENNLQSTFSNIEIVLSLYLVLMVFNYSREQSFSKMKFIKTDYGL